MYSPTPRSAVIRWLWAGYSFVIGYCVRTPEIFHDKAEIIPNAGFFYPHHGLALNIVSGESIISALDANSGIILSTRNFPIRTDHPDAQRTLGDPLPV